jgi:hypothetical protein
MKANKKKAWKQPVVFRPSEEDKAMLDWLSRHMYLKASQVLRQGLKKMYDAEKRTARKEKGNLTIKARRASALTPAQR